MIDNFILYALLAGIGIAVSAGSLGCFVVWRRMAYFGDSLSHSSLLGIALGVVYGLSHQLGIIAVCALFSLLLLWLEHKQKLSTDTLLGILAHSALAIGMVAISLSGASQIDLHSYLFGDLLSITSEDLYWAWAITCIVVVTLIIHWPLLLLSTLHRDLAQAEGISLFRMQCVLLLLMTITVATAIHMVGALLITALLIIPAATARSIAHAPKTMAISSTFVGVLSVILGVYASLEFDTPTGPTIISISAVLFVLSLVFSKKSP